MPAGGREVAQPLQRPFEHELRLAGTQACRIHGKVTVFRVVTTWRTQLNQFDTARDGFLHTAQKLDIVQPLGGDQILAGQTCRRNDRLIGSRKVIIGQLTRAGPDQRLPFCAMRLASECRDLPDVQQHLLVRIVVKDLDQRTRRRHQDAQLFLQFTCERGLDGFALLDLAARKLPEAALMLSVGTSGNQYTAVSATNDGGGHMNSFHDQDSSRPACCQRLKAGHW